MATVEIDQPAMGESGKIKHKQLLKWVEDVAGLCKPDQVYFCDGSKEEYQEMLRLMLQAGTAIELNPKKRPGSIFVRSDTADVARVEDRTYICSPTRTTQVPRTTGKTRSKCGEAHGTLHRVHARPHHVCDSLLHGTDRIADFEDRSGDQRFTLCRRQYAHHGAGRRRGPGRTRHRR